ncbi:hypothetical protein Trydic_g11350 [Trypoxylus dichotomus]
MFALDICAVIAHAFCYNCNRLQPPGRNKRFCYTVLISGSVFVTSNICKAFITCADLRRYLVFRRTWNLTF